MFEFGFEFEFQLDFELVDVELDLELEPKFKLKSSEPSLSGMVRTPTTVCDIRVLLCLSNHLQRTMEQ